MPPGRWRYQSRDAHRRCTRLPFPLPRAPRSRFNSTVLLGEALKTALRNAKLPMAVHDYKSALPVLRGSGIEIAAVRDDPMLYSYLLDPTYSSHRPEGYCAAALQPKLGVERTLASGRVRHLEISPAEAADWTGRIASVLRKEVEEAGLMPGLRAIDLPLVPVLARMEEAGVKIDCGVLGGISAAAGPHCDAKARDIYGSLRASSSTSTRPSNLAKCFSKQLNLPKPSSTARATRFRPPQDVLEGLAAASRSATAGAGLPPALEAEVHLCGCVPALPNHAPASAHHFQPGRHGHRPAVVEQSELAEHSHTTELGREIRAAFIAEPGNVLLAADYSQIELRLLAHFSQIRC